MKILVASFTFPPNKDGVSEAASACVSLFLQKGWQVDVATEPTFPARQQADWKGATIHEFSITGGGSYRYPYQGELEKYQRFLLSGTWDVILFQGYLWPLYLAVPLLEKISAKKILVSHGYGALLWTPAKRFPFGLGVLAHSVIQSLDMLTWMRRINRVVFLSKRRDLRAFYDHTLARLIRHPGIRIIPNGVEVDKSADPPGEFRKIHGISQETVLFLCVANYSSRKDQGFAARAFRLAALPGSVLVFIGSELNEDSERFQKEDEPYSTSNPPGKILWLEKQDRRSTLQAFSACDVFVLSANHEAQPIALLEAMREGKPWIAGNAGCIPEMEGGICIRTVRQMARAMRKLANDQHGRERLGGRGRNAIETDYNRAFYDERYYLLGKELFAP